MTPRPPTAQPQEQPRPSAQRGDGGKRLTTALVAGGSVLLLSTTTVALWPSTYGTEAIFAIDGGVPNNNPTALASRVEAALLERHELSGVATELPPELRAPDPIGRLRAGIRVQSRGGKTFSVEFRGSEKHSVQRIANRLAERAVALLPQLAAAPEDKAPALALAQRTRAVTEFLTAHPEVSLEASGAKPSGNADSGLEALRTERRQIEQRLSTEAPDNPYSDPELSPEILNRRLTEIKNAIARREKALHEPRAAATPSATPELAAQWRTLLADLATAQAAASAPSGPPPLAAHVVTAAPLPASPLTPNRLLLGVVAALLSAAAAVAAYLVPRFAQPPRRNASPSPSEPPRAAQPTSDAPPMRPTQPSPLRRPIPARATPRRPPRRRAAPTDRSPRSGRSWCRRRVRSVTPRQRPCLVALNPRIARLNLR
jgi:hypothetical protein